MPFLQNYLYSRLYKWFWSLIQLPFQSVDLSHFYQSIQKVFFSFLELRDLVLFLIFPQSLDSAVVSTLLSILQLNLGEIHNLEAFITLEFFISHNFHLFKGIKVHVNEVGDVLENIGIELTPKELWKLLKTLPITCEHFWYCCAFRRMQFECIYCWGRWGIIKYLLSVYLYSVYSLSTSQVMGIKTKIRALVEAVVDGADSTGIQLENFIKKLRF